MGAEIVRTIVMVRAVKINTTSSITALLHFERRS